MEGVSLLPYKLVKPNYFCFVTITSRNSEKITLALNTGNETYIVSSSYEVFYVKDSSKVLPEYIYLWFCRPEFDRYARFNSWGSAREAFSFEDMKRVRIPLPSIEVQRTIVDAWKSLRNIKEQNDALAAPLMQLCQSYIQDCKNAYPMCEIGPYIEQFNEKNKNNEIKLEQGINIKKEFITPQRSNSDLSSRVIVRHGQIAYCTQLNNENVAIAYREGPDCVVSPVYNVISSKDESVLLNQFLFLWLTRSEFGRYVYWASKGSAYEFLVYENLCSAKIPLAPIEVQRAIVSLYQCAIEYRKIAAEADAQSRSICSALMQHAINN
jgi:type I restriction enzyme S subunit